MSNEQTWLAAVNHDECSMDFDPKLNIIIGPNNIGKSRTMRFLIRCVSGLEKEAEVGIAQGEWRNDAVEELEILLNGFVLPAWVDAELNTQLKGIQSMVRRLLSERSWMTEAVKEDGLYDNISHELTALTNSIKSIADEETVKIGVLDSERLNYVVEKNKVLGKISEAEYWHGIHPGHIVKIGGMSSYPSTILKECKNKLSDIENEIKVAQQKIADQERVLNEIPVKSNNKLSGIAHSILEMPCRDQRTGKPRAIGGAKLVYVSSLRGIRRILSQKQSLCSFDESSGVREFVQDRWQGDRISGNELFRSFIANSYKGTFKAESVRYWPDDDDERNGEGRVITLFTGLEMYQDLESRLLGTQEKRQSVAEFEHWISEHFFFGKQVTLTPNRKKERVHVTIGEDEKPIHELGEGIQTLLMLTYAARMIGEGIYFIEEPELSLHAGMQRLLLEQLLSLPNRQYFFTTHSPHMIDMANDYKGSVYTIESPPAPLGEKPKETSTGRLERIDQSNLDLGKLLGARYSSLLTVNAMLWVEGIGDRKILQRFLELKQKKLVEENGSEQKVYKESIHFGFFEYAGTLVEHYDFSDPEEDANGDIDDDKIKARRIATNILLITDDDGVGDLFDDVQTLDESVTADQDGDSVLDAPKEHVDVSNVIEVDGDGDVPLNSGSSVSETSSSNLDTEGDRVDGEDEKKKVDPKEERFRRLCKQLGKDRFYKLKVREIENLIPLEVLADYIKANHRRKQMGIASLKNYIEVKYPGKSITDYAELFDEAIERLRNPPKANNNDARIARERPIDIPEYSQRKVKEVPQVTADLDEEYVGTYVDAVMGSLITQFGAKSSKQVFDDDGNLDPKGSRSVTRYHGTINEKRAFVEEAVKMIESYDDLDPKAKDLTETVYAFIEKMNS